MFKQSKPGSSVATNLPRLRQVEWREWWLWGFAVAVTLVLTFGILALTFPGFHMANDRLYTLSLKEWVRGLAALVLLFDIYTVFQHLQLQRMRYRLAERDQIFQLISENAADMIAVVDKDGSRLYNSPAYQKILGYSRDELANSSPMDQIHPDDRARVQSAADKARITGTGERLEYRIRHKNGSWRVLESTSNAIRGVNSEVEGLVVVNRDITERKRAEEMLTHNAFHDGLTNLANRTLFLDRLGRALAISKRHAEFKFAVLFIDIDGFKVFNDSLGHVAGDALLIQIAGRLLECLRRVDTISRQWQSGETDSVIGDNTLARPGGDEFAVLAEELRNPSDAIRVAERIQEKLSLPFDVEGQKIVITASIGIAFSNNPTALAEDVLRDSEIAMYRAKHSGKARCEVFDNAMHTGALKRLQLETDMRRGLELGEFLVYYQPIVSLQNGRIVGFEALTRWQSPTGMVMPNDFIPVANETGIILSINRELLIEACRQLLHWQQLFPSDPPLSLSVNISQKEFAQADLASQFGRLLQEGGVDPKWVNLEITETSAMADAERSAGMLAQLKALGVGLDIDDFGTGYSSLSRLQRLPVDTLKIDRAFVSRVDSDQDTYEIVRIIVMLAHNLGLTVVAEGVETLAQLDLIRKVGCERAQGYLFSRPVDHHTILKLLEANRSTPAGFQFKAAKSASA
jgi:diguanylate cyclase (GGDEF)-like protein/PAS domain S-box-containing protein